MRRAIQYSTVVRRLTGISYHRPPQVTVKVWLFPGELWYLYRPLERVFLTYVRRVARVFEAEGASCKAIPFPLKVGPLKVTFWWFGLKCAAASPEVGQSAKQKLSPLATAQRRPRTRKTLADRSAQTAPCTTTMPDTLFCRRRPEGRRLAIAATTLLLYIASASRDASALQIGWRARESTDFCSGSVSLFVFRDDLLLLCTCTQAAAQALQEQKNQKHQLTTSPN